MIRIYQSLTAERLMLVGLTAAALVLLLEAVRVGLWIEDLPGPGLYPGALLLLIASLSIALSISSRQTDAISPSAADREPRRSGDVAIVATTLVLIPILLPLIGFRLLAFAYLLGLMLFLARSITWAATLKFSLLAALIAFGSYAFFAAAFKVLLPVGRLTGF